MSPEQGRGVPESAVENEEVAQKVAQIENQLRDYAEEQGLEGLEGRVDRGLDPAAILGVEETRAIVEDIAEELNVDMDNLDELTSELHVGAIWNNAERLAEGEDGDIQALMIITEASQALTGQESDLEPEELLENLDRIVDELTEAKENTEEYLKKVKENLVEESEGKFKVEDGVPIATSDDCEFLDFAVSGHETGIIEDSEGLLFVGSEELDFSILEDKFGLEVQTREDRGREVDFYVNEQGEDVAKELYPGFGIVLNGDKEIAKELAKTGQTSEAETE